MLMSSIQTDVHFLELRRLLTDLKDHAPNVCIRFRLIGELWQNSYFKILKLTDDGVALLDDPSNKLVFIKNLNDIMQFEVDGPFRNFQPHVHYSVKIN